MAINYDYHEVYDSPNFNYDGDLEPGGTSTSTSTSTTTSTTTTIQIDFIPKLDKLSMDESELDIISKKVVR